MRWFSLFDRKPQPSPLALAREARDEAYRLYRDACARRDTRDQHATHRILVARVNDVLKLERAA